MKLRLPAFIPHQPTPKQMAFLMFDGLEAFYGGAAGGGKTDALLMSALQYIDVPGYSAIIFRRSFTDLALSGAIMDRAHQWLSDYKKAGKVHWDRDLKSYTFPNGSKLSFGFVQTQADKWRYQSAEFQFIAWDEITEFPDDDAYRFLFTRLRRLKDSTIPLRVRSASNPIGRGSYWVKKRFLENTPPAMDLDGNPDPHERIFIPATYNDNPHIDQQAYGRSLAELPESTRDKLIHGSWEAIENPAFEDFDRDIHVVAPIVVPDLAVRFEAMDFGVSNPTAWYSAAKFPDESIIVNDEFYRPGLVSETASRILTFRAHSWGNPVLAVCDPSIKNATGFGDKGRGETVHSEFSKNGIYLVPAKNDRLAGRVRVTELLRPDPARLFPEWHPRAGELGSPRLFISTRCPNLIEQIEHAPIDPVEGEIVDPYWESRSGHAVAALRYLVSTRVATPEDVSREWEPGTRRFKDWNNWEQWREA